MKSLFIGFDLGSHASKGVIIDGNGFVLASETLKHGTNIVNAGWQEQIPAVWWEEFKQISAVLLQKSHVEPSLIGAVGITGFVPGLVLIDRKSNVIRPAIMHTDIRATSQLLYLNEILDTPITHGFLLPKLLWVRDQEKSHYRNIEKILVPHSYIVQRLTGKFSCDVDTATVFGGIYDEKAGSWSGRLCSRLGIDLGILPDLYNSDSVVANITPEASRETGLAADTPVIAGTGDSFASILGCGAVLPGDMMIYLGTSGTQIFMNGRFSEIVGRRHFGPGKAEFAGRIISCGDSMEHFKGLLGFTNWSLPDSKALEIEPGSQGLFIFPHLKQKGGRESSEKDLETIFGLETSHTGWHIYRALLEGIAYNLKTSFTLYESRVKRLILSGGGARSRVFREVIRDILGKEIYYNSSGNGAVGIALLAAHGADTNTLQEISLLKSNEADRLEPDSKTVDTYGKYYKEYIKLRKSIELLYREQENKHETIR